MEAFKIAHVCRTVRKIQRSLPRPTKHICDDKVCERAGIDEQELHAIQFELLKQGRLHFERKLRQAKSGAVLGFTQYRWVKQAN